ncbi:MAG: type I-C CRISPR-associated endonuclease Cas1c [Chloroflexota bacterium]
MPELLNVLYIQTQGALLRLDHDTVSIRLDEETKHRVPLLRLDGLVLFGRVSITPFLIQRCAEEGRSLVWMTRHGRFRGRLSGPTTGNVLLRRDQHQALADPETPWRIARQIIAAKIQNSRNQIMRSARDTGDASDKAALSEVAERLAGVLVRLKDITGLDEIRGAEGEAARAYFSVFTRMIRQNRNTFAFERRTRRPPRDPTNAILSFLYTLLTAECAAALEGVGLDPQVGYLHALRPGRPALALDIVEELRAPLVDRLTLTLINRRQLQEKHFEEKPGGALYLNEDGRRTVLVAYQERKEDEIEHRTLDTKIPFGLVPHVQARLLARYLRGDMRHYPPFIYR